MDNTKLEEIIPIHDIWACYSPYIKGKVEDIENLIAKEKIRVVNRKQINGVSSCRVVDERSFYPFVIHANISAQLVQRIIKNYPEVRVACIFDGDPFICQLTVAVVMSECGYPFITLANKVGSRSAEGDCTMDGFEDLFTDYKNSDSTPSLHSGALIETSVDYHFPFMEEWLDDKAFFEQNRSVVLKRNNKNGCI